MATVGLSRRPCPPWKHAIGSATCKRRSRPLLERAVAEISSVPNWHLSRENSTMWHNESGLELHKRDDKIVSQMPPVSNFSLCVVSSIYGDARKKYYDLLFHSWMKARVQQPSSEYLALSRSSQLPRFCLRPRRCFEGRPWFCLLWLNDHDLSYD